MKDPQDPSTWPIVDVYEYYDGPKLFLTESPPGQLYFVWWTQTNRRPQWDKWLYIPVSRDRVTLLTSGEMPLRRAVDDCESDRVLRVTTYDSGHRTQVDPVALSEIAETEKPSAEALLVERTPSQKLLPVPPLAAELYAERHQRDVVDLRLEPGGGHTTRLDTRDLGTLLIRFRSLLLYIADPSRRRGRPARELEDRSAMLVEALYPGSFGIRLVAKDGALIESPVHQTLGTLFTLLRSVSGEADMGKELESLEEFQPSVRVRFLLFLRALVEADSSLDSVWASPRTMVQQVYLPRSRLIGTVEAMGHRQEIFTESLEVSGRLWAVDVRQGRARFHLQGDDGQELFGHIASPLLTSTQVWKVGRAVRMTGVVKRSVEVDALTAEERFRDVLVAVTNLEECDTD